MIQPFRPLPSPPLSPLAVPCVRFLGSEDYIECESCNEWYHFSCEGLDGTNPPDVYSCKRCRQLAAKGQKVSAQERRRNKAKTNEYMSQMVRIGEVREKGVKRYGDKSGRIGLLRSDVVKEDFFIRLLCFDGSKSMGSAALLGVRGPGRELFLFLCSPFCPLCSVP